MDHGSNTHINVLDIREESLEDGERGYLANKISKLIGFFNLIFGELNEEEKAIIEEKLKWKQVLEMRKVKKSIEKIHRFRRWVNVELGDKSKAEVIEIIEKAMDDYKFALKKHGIMTTNGGITTILSAAATLIEALSGDISTQISAGLIISGGLITYTAAQLGEYFEKKREPIALIYDLESKN